MIIRCTGIIDCDKKQFCLPHCKIGSLQLHSNWCMVKIVAKSDLFFILELRKKVNNNTSLEFG